MGVPSAVSTAVVAARHSPSTITPYGSPPLSREVVLAPTLTVPSSELTITRAPDGRLQAQMDAFTAEWRAAREDDKARIDTVEREQLALKEAALAQTKVSNEGIEALTKVLAASIASNAEAQADMRAANAAAQAAMMAANLELTQNINALLNRDRSLVQAAEPETPLRSSRSATQAKPGRPATSK